MRVTATAKFIGTSSRKIGLVAGLIRGHSVIEAERLLAASTKRATDPVGKVLRSAIANAENNSSLKKADLVITSVLVGPGPTLKRMRPRARGSAGAIMKRSSHITVVLNDQKPVLPAKAEATEPAAAKPAAKKTVTKKAEK